MRWSTVIKDRTVVDARASVVLGALAVGCAASGPDDNAYLTRWLGVNTAGLVADWGPPDYRYRDHRGRETLQYIKHQVVFEALSSGRKVVWWCLTNFHIGTVGRVETLTTKGNHCFPPEDLAGDRLRRRRGKRALPVVPPSDGVH